MKKSFTLIELLISFTVLSLISGGALVYLNNFNSQQKLTKTRDEVISTLKLAQSYAKTRQLPLNSLEKELKYVQIQILNNNLVIGANGIGSTFFNMVSNDDVGISSTSTMIYFWGGNGFLSRGNTGPMFGVGETVKISVQVKSKKDDFSLITIDSLGLISVDNYNYFSPTLVPTLMPTLVLTPTRVPTIVMPTNTYPTPISTPISTPTPPLTCRSGGMSCRVNGDCCSYYCSSLHFCY